MKKCIFMLSLIMNCILLILLLFIYVINNVGHDLSKVHIASEKITSGEDILAKNNFLDKIDTSNIDTIILNNRNFLIYLKSDKNLNNYFITIDSLLERKKELKIKNDFIFFISNSKDYKIIVEEY